MIQTAFLAYYFPPLGGAGVQRAQSFVRHLPSMGCLPLVVTGPGNENGRWTPQDRSLHDGLPAEVPVHRTSEPLPIEGRRFSRRIETWLGRPHAFDKWWTRAAFQAAQAIRGPVDLVFATMSPFATCGPAARLAQQWRVPWVADLRDPWALDEVQVYPSAWHRCHEMQRMERLLSTAAVIIMNTPDAAAALRNELPALRARTIVTITNGYDSEDFSSPLPPRPGGTFRIVHSGYLHTADGLRLRQASLHRLLGGAMPGVDLLTRSHAVLLEAVESWLLARPEARRDLEIVFAGQLSEEDRQLAQASPVASSVRFTGYVPHAESLALVRTADLLFLPMHDLPPGRRARIVPGKTYEYMASGRPILAAVPDGDARDFLAQCGTAFLCRPDDAAAMAGHLDTVYSAWKSGRTITDFRAGFAARFERRNLTRTLSDVFHTLLQRTPSRPEPAAAAAAMSQHRK